MSQDDLVECAADLVRAGHTDQARITLRDVLLEDQENIQAWAGLASLAESKRETTIYLRQMLKLEPENEWAIKRLASLQSEDSKAM
jgi:Tfp pilus assembly protein PilF